MLLALALAVLAGCGLVTSFSGLAGSATGDGGDGGASGEAGATDATVLGDAAPSDDGSLDAAVAKCDRHKAFNPPTLVSMLNAPQVKSWGRLTGDELTIYFQSSGNTGAQIFASQRASRMDAFGAPSLVIPGDNTNLNYDPMISLDGLTLVFCSEREGGLGARDLFVASKATGFGVATPLTVVNSSGDEAQPYFSPSNAALWIGRDNDLVVARSNGTTFMAPVPLVDLNTASEEQFPVPSIDSTYIYFSSSRGGGSSNHIFFSERPTVSSSFGTPTAVTEVNASGEDFPTWLSPDGCRLYLTSSRGGALDLWVAERTP